LIQINGLGSGACQCLRVSDRQHHQPEEPAPRTDHYEQLNVFGTPTGVVVHVSEGEKLPAAPRGFLWRRVVRPERC